MKTSNSIFLCSDMDRTLLPNGDQEESPAARECFRRVCARPEIILAYVSGRRSALQKEAIKEYGLPTPNFSVGDVGTSIYRVREDGEWTQESDWHRQIAESWRGLTAEDLARLLTDVKEIRLQEPEAQGPFKLSYYAPDNIDKERLLGEVKRRLEERQVKAGLIWSVDETCRQGLLDILPERASKRHAVEYLKGLVGVPDDAVVYAGDSGNDLAVLTSGIPSVLVANATAEVREEARREVESQGLAAKLYFARGGFLGMNGNYAAGILEGLAHFRPECRAWMSAD